jgi:hypothetical protein
MINPGTRPSRLALARHATGEAPLPSPDPTTQRWLAGLAAERARMEPFDFEVLRARAARLADEPPARREAAAPPWYRRVWLAVPLLAFAAAAVIAVRAPDGDCGPGDLPCNRIKGDVDLGFFVLRDGRVYPGDPGERLRAGDRVQFTYRAPYASVVLLSVDGLGRLTVYYPEAGERGVAIVPGERHVLDGSILLDDAPGPEVFLAFFGEAWTVSRARDTVEDTLGSEGVAGLAALAEDPTIAALPLEKE